MARIYEAPTIDDREMWRLWMSKNRLPAVTAADEIGLFRALSETPLSAETLARTLDVNPRAASALLSLLASMGFVRRSEGLYQTTNLARTYMHPDSPFYWGSVFHLGRERDPVHADMMKALGTTEKRSSYSGAVEAWESGQLGPEQARAIAAFMHAHSLPAAVGAAINGGFDGVRRLLDVGGGSGVFTIAIAQRWPDLSGTVMDLAAMCAAAQSYIEEAGVAHRVDTAAVDMFREPWPQGYDALFFSNIFHDWDEATCAELAAKAHAALPAGGRIYIHEMLMDDDGDGPEATVGFSMLMLLSTRGRQFAFGELKTMLEGAGFRDVAARQTCGCYSLVSAEKPGG